jgi:Zn-dependent protease with chaperone function
MSSSSAPYPIRLGGTRSRARPPAAQWGDLALAHLPDNSLTVAWLMIMAFSYAAIGTCSLLTGAVLGLLTTARFAFFQQRNKGALAALRVRAPTMKRVWQPRYFLIRRLARHFAAQAGVEGPEIILDGKGLIGPLNATALELDRHSVILVNPHLFEQGVEKILSETAVAGVMAHEIAHLRTGRLEGGTTITTLRRAYLDAMIPGVMVCILFAGAPINLVFPMLASLGAITYLPLMARRREEIEADRVGASLFARNGRSAILGGLLLMNVANSANPSRFVEAVERASRFGALSVGPDFTRICSEMVSVHEQRSLRERLLRWYSRLAHPWHDHPDVESVARLLGLRQLEHDIALEPGGTALPADHIVISVTVSRTDGAPPLI